MSIRRPTLHASLKRFFRAPEDVKESVKDTHCSGSLQIAKAAKRSRAACNAATGNSQRPNLSFK